MSIEKQLRDLAAVVAVALGALPAAAATVSAVPAVPTYGEAIRAQLANSGSQEYLPATRFTRSGNHILIDYEFLEVGFGPFEPGAPSGGTFRPVVIGELVPGTYSLEARLSSSEFANVPATTIRTSFAVMPPEAPGMYLVPRAPAAWEAANVVLRSAAYFDPSTLRASVAGGVIRLDFDYDSHAVVGGPAPSGYAAVASVPIDGLAPGAYLVEGYGRAVPDGVPTKYFTLAFSIGATMPVFEYYSAALGHYFLAGGPDEVKLLDAGGQGDWRRTGHKFKAWLHQADAPSNARPVCRFYAFGPNSHFFTADAFECAQLKDLERSQRAQAAAAGAAFLGWGYEGIGFWALDPDSGSCPAGADPLHRAYNDRAAQGDSNHRFTPDPVVQAAMIDANWLDEGAQLCSPR